ncbi:MAG: tetratricopeptide repeat protein [Chloroflexi bacterium]|nr:tetratricopeptide repeat protein [Chloroflexota bacterium]
MAEISLRTYLEEVDRLIDGNQVDEAIAHARHILTIYPKHLDAYRLLAKALLEKNRHLDAADVFQRVLSSVPDDFVSHVGMAIVREDEGNLDAALWHMERAFEAQPANMPIQDELKRLYARRDGLEPPKIRLTRAALARLYEKGDHYPQAIAELQIALADEPERLDLKVLLAQTLWRARMRAEAAETCAKLLAVLPFCREANRILANIWHETGRNAEAQVYRKKLEALDPYEAYANPAENGHGAMNTPAEVVRIPRLDYIAPTDMDASRPDWMQALGLQFDQPAQPAEPQAAATDVPDWLAGFDTPAPPAETTVQAKHSGGTDWLTALSGGQELPEALEAAPAEASADLPSWLKPPPGTDELKPPAQEDDWMSKLDEAPAAEQQAIPDWLKEPEPEAKTRTGTTDWLNNLFGEPAAETATADSGVAATAGEPATELPDWLQPESSSEAPAAKADLPAEVPAWMAEAPAVEPATTTTAAPPTEAAQPAEASAQGEEAIPDWMVAAGWSLRDPSKPLDEGPLGLEPEPEPEAPTAEAEAITSNDLPDWLKSMKPPEEAPAPPAAEATPAKDTPDWLNNIMNSAAQPAPAEPAPAELPSWLSAAEPESQAIPAEAAAPADELPAWLREADANPNDTVAMFLKRQAVEPTESDTTPGVPDRMKAEETPTQPAAEEEDLPDWLKPAVAQPKESKKLDTGELFIQKLQTGELEKAATPALPPTPEPVMPALDDPDQALAWLESLALKQGAKEEELVSKPEARNKMTEPPAEVPAWLREPVEEPPPPVEPALSAQPEPAEIPAWLRPPVEDLKPEPEASIPDWLRQPAEAQSDLPPVQAESIAPQDMSADDALAWLESLALKQGAKEEELVSKPEARSKVTGPLSEPPAEVPAWLRQADNTAAEEQAETPTQLAPAAESPVEDQSWLRQPVEEATPAEPAELPAWLRPAGSSAVEAAPEVPSTPAASSVESMSEDDALAWLESLAINQGAKEEEMVTKPEARRKATGPLVEPPVQPPTQPAPVEAAQPESELPAWLQTQHPAPESEVAVTDWLNKSAPPVTEPPPPPPAPEKPDWLKQMEAEADAFEAMMSQPAEPAPSELSTSSEDEALAWLEALAAKQEVSQPEAPVETPAWLKEESAEIAKPAEGATPEDTMRDWLRQPPEAMKTILPEWARQAQEAEATAEEKAEEPAAFAAPPLGSEDEALAWLESLALKQGAKEEELVSKPQERRDEMPDWVRAKTAMLSEPPAAEPEPEPALPTIDDWVNINKMPVPEDVAPVEAPTPVEAATPAPEPVAAIAPEVVEPKPKKPSRPKRPRPARKPKLRSGEEPPIVLAVARERLMEENFEQAVEVYAELTHAGELLPDIIADLEAANQKNPRSPELLRALGDAYMKDNQLQKALDVYRAALQQL